MSMWVGIDVDPYRWRVGIQMAQRIRGVVGVCATVATITAFGLVPAAPAWAGDALTTQMCTKRAVLDGSNGSDIIQYVPVTASGSTNCFVQEDDANAGVRGLQHSLNVCYLGISGFKTKLVEDGDFGPATKSALESAQRSETHPAIAVDGEYGANTRAQFTFIEVDGGGDGSICIRFNSETWTVDQFD
jgi:peptidoglycan hydrolase-like protein with peptidoglycan-binding domain